ncbi:hypothetical protein RsoM2USA_8 [Ralstonia phage RsoM2USA]|nr:hypothetical protein RsoM2USA_8 [Ralstonia phage RsoM2USA]
MFSTKDKRLFDVAKSVSYTSDYKYVQMGAVIARNRNVLSVGTNQTKTHTLQKEFNVHRKFDTVDVDHCIHAEIDAINKVRYRDLSNCSIYIYREKQEKKKTVLGMARPCAACMEAIIRHGIKHVYYTTENGFAYERINI